MAGTPGSHSRMDLEPGFLRVASLPPAGGEAAGPQGSLLRVEAARADPFVVHNFHGNFDRLGGSTAFINAILKGLDHATLEQLRNCSLGLRGETTAARGDDNISLWIILNAEGEGALEAWNKRIQAWVAPRDRVLLLGTRWNEARKDDIVREGRVTSMYIPFASLNFAERHYHTPMDLYLRSNGSSVNFSRERKGDLAYQQNNCKPGHGQYRAATFTALDSALRAAGRMPGSALAKCHGENPPGGYVNADGVNCDENCTCYDRSVGRYEDFRLALTMEHTTRVEHSGYITEKMVNAFLAGAVLVSDSSAERAEVFSKESYVAVDADTPEGRRDGAKAVLDLLRDPQEWERKRRLPSVTAESLRKYFSWHPAVWPSHGDRLRRQIVDEVLRMCN